jgi:peroxiredoxin Q/BCP
MLNKGAVAPDFELADQQGEMTTLTQLLANGNVIVYFYPIDFSPVCTAQACGFRDNYAGAAKLGTQVVGISPQNVETHLRFSQLHSLPFPLLADPKKQAIRAYGVDGPFGMGVRRASFLVNKDQVIVKRVVSEFFVGSHTDLLRETIN